jgi:hypothetical protein
MRPTTPQTTVLDGLLTQAFNNTTLSPQNAYTINLAGATLTTGGAGNVVEIDNMLSAMWNQYKVTVDVIYVNAQELKNITYRVLNGSSAPLRLSLSPSRNRTDKAIVLA